MHTNINMLAHFEAFASGTRRLPVEPPVYDDELRQTAARWYGCAPTLDPAAPSSMLPADVSDEDLEAAREVYEECQEFRRSRIEDEYRKSLEAQRQMIRKYSVVTTS